MDPQPLRTIPVYRNSLALCELSRQLASYFSFNKDLLKLYQSNSLRDSIADAILTDAILIPQKIELAEKSSCPEVRLQNTTYINIMLRNMVSYCNGLEHDGVKEKEYLNLLRTEMGMFRTSFKKWRKSILSR